MEKATKPKRKSVLDWYSYARRAYPDKYYNWWQAYGAGRSKIDGFEKDFSQYLESHGLNVVLLLVNVLDRDTRSPAKKQAVADWRKEYAIRDN